MGYLDDIGEYKGLCHISGYSDSKNVHSLSLATLLLRMELCCRLLLLSTCVYVLDYLWWNAITKAVNDPSPSLLQLMVVMQSQ